MEQWTECITLHMNMYSVTLLYDGYDFRFIYTRWTALHCSDRL